jgi:acyl-CoA ligase (AMP-forming) (exosortase A-associated)
VTNIPYLLHHLLDERPGDSDRIALIDGNRSLSHRDLSRFVAGCANALRSAGLSRGDRAAIMLPKSTEECWAIFGVSSAGGVFVPINPLLKPAQMRHIVVDSEAAIVITSRALFETVSEALVGVALKAVVCAEDIIASPTNLLAAPDDAAIGEDLAAILYTSGSTGGPKGVMLSHRNLLAGTRIVIRYLEITERDRILSILPFSFDYGLNQLLTAVQQRATTVLFTFRRGDELVQALSDYSITGVAGVPTIWAILTRGSPLLRRTSLPALRYITNSGGAVPTETAGRLRELLPDTRIFLMYGLTEAFRSTFLPPEQIDKRPTSIGKAIPECEVFAIRPDGRRARPGEPGILVHRGPTVALGYWKRPEDTARVFRPHPFIAAEQGGEIVCYSGDLVVEDDDGFFSFVGRNDAMIKSAGYRISPTEVEGALMATSAFDQVAVIGLPDPLVGQTVHAVAVPRTEIADTTPILQSLSDQLPAFMVPRTIELVGSLPTTPNGKIDYRLLREQRSKDVVA